MVAKLSTAVVTMPMSDVDCGNSDQSCPKKVLGGGGVSRPLNKTPFGNLKVSGGLLAFEDSVGQSAKIES